MFWDEGPRTASKSPLERGGPLAVGCVLFSKDGFSQRFTTREERGSFLAPASITSRRSRPHFPGCSSGHHFLGCSSQHHFLKCSSPALRPLMLLSALRPGTIFAGIASNVL